MKQSIISKKEADTIDTEVEFDTTISKALNFLSFFLILSGLILWFIILGRNEADILATNQLVKLGVATVMCVGIGVWMELKSQRHRKHQTFAEYMADKHTYDYDDYDYLQDGDDYDA